ncbi:MAG: TatD family hydrolase [Gammaproteobacteria bacterium]|nr:TatD family hydrolase [Gammaproteobacteria bacterium]
MSLSGEASLVDSHCHLPMISADPDTIIAAARDNGVSHMLCISVDLETFPDVLALAARYECVDASVGVHPNSRDGTEPDQDGLVSAAGDARVVAIGETGLDYFRSRGTLDWQRERFRVHIRAALSAGKPLIVHSREARADVLTILEEEGADRVGGVMHCFVEDWDSARRAMDLNFYISFSGIVTFKSARTLHDVARRVPLDRMLVETDSPYLAPVPFRGRENQPAYVRYIAEHNANLRSADPEEVAAATTQNFFRLFNRTGELKVKSGN